MRSLAISALFFWQLAGLLAGAEPASDSPQLYRIWVDKKIGFIDRTGRVVVEPMFDWAYEFSEGLCQARLGDKEGYIHPTGNWAFQIDTHDDRPFQCGVAITCTGKRTGIVDPTGHVIDCPFDWMEEFSEGLSAVAIYEKAPVNGPVGWRQKKWGFVDTKGKLIIPIEYTGVGSFSEGLAAIYVGGSDEMCTGLTGGKWGFIDRNGEMVIKPQFTSVGSFSEGLAAVTFDRQNYGWIDTTGKFAIKMKRLSIGMPFHDGVAFLRGAQDSVPGWNDFGYITKQGDVFVHPVFDGSLGPFSEGLAEARGKPTWDADKNEWIQGKYGFVDKQGSWVIQPQFTHTRPFRNGLAYVRKDGQTMAYVNTKGAVVWPAAAEAAPK